MSYLISASAVVIHYEEALYQVYAPLSFTMSCHLWWVSIRQSTNQWHCCWWSGRPSALAKILAHQVLTGRPVADHTQPMTTDHGKQARWTNCQEEINKEPSCSDLSKRAFADERVDLILVIPPLSRLDDVIVVLIIITFIQHELLLLPTVCWVHAGLRPLSVLLLQIVDLQQQQLHTQQGSSIVIYFQSSL